MRSLSTLLLFSTLASALPLRKGASLGYRVWRGAEEAACFVRLTIGDSTATDSGVLWSVAIRDSLMGGDRIRNAHAVLRVAHGDTVWQTPSCLVAWDPASRKVDTISWKAGDDSAKYDYPYPFGAIGGACQNSSPDTYEPVQFSTSKLRSYRLRDSTRDWIGGLLGMVSFSYPLPYLERRGDSGMVRLVDRAIDERWNLAEIDGRSLGGRYDWPPLGALHVDFRLGRTWVWRDVGSREGTAAGSKARFTKQYARNYRLTVVSVPADSGEWKRCGIQWIASDSTYTVALPAVQGSWTSTTSTDTLWLRVNQREGRVSITGTDLQERLVAEGLLRLDTDRPAVDGRFVRTSSDSTVSTNMLSGSTHLYIFFDSMTLMKDFGAVAIHYKQQEQGGTVSAGAYRDTGSMVLLAMDSYVLSDGEYRLGIGARRDHPVNTRHLSTLNDLERELSSRSGAVVRITALTGWSVVQTGPEALGSLRSMHGIVLLELRHGRTSLRGRLLLP